MEELLKALDYANNVKSVKLDCETKMWTVEYKNNLSSDTMSLDELIDYLLYDIKA